MPRYKTWTEDWFQKPCPCRSGKLSRKCFSKAPGWWRKAPLGALIPTDRGFSHTKCYLSSFGNCGQKITKEHFISRNILERITSSTLVFKNASYFFGKESVEIGIDSFSAKILCDSHNSALSPLDAAAGAFFSAMESFVKNLVSASSNRNLVDLQLASGLDLERWLIKVYCGLVAAGKIRGLSGLARSLADIPGVLFEALVGRASLPPPFGLYAHAYKGQIRNTVGVSFSTIQLSDGSDEVGGIFLSLGAMNLVLVTHAEFGSKFTDPNFFRHPRALFDIDTAECKLGFLMSY